MNQVLIHLHVELSRIFGLKLNFLGIKFVMYLILNELNKKS